MLMLILETSSEKGCLVLARGRTSLAVRKVAGGPELSKMLALETSRLLGGEIPEVIAVGTGPGSYTGIRVAAALGKGLAYGWQVPLVGFCSLEAFGPAPVLVDARMGGFYAFLEGAPQLLSPTDPLLQAFASFGSPHPENIKKRLGVTATVAEREPDPDRLANLAFEAFVEGKTGPLKLQYLSHP